MNEQNELNKVLECLEQAQNVLVLMEHPKENLLDFFCTMYKAQDNNTEATRILQRVYASDKAKYNKEQASNTSHLKVALAICKENVLDYIFMTDNKCITTDFVTYAQSILNATRTAYNFINKEIHQ